MTVTRPILAFLLAALSGGSALASDFSKMGDPTYARVVLISDARRLELDCAGLALSGFDEAGLNQPLSREQAKQLGDAVTARLATELGGKEAAASFLDNKAAFLIPYGDDELQKEVTEKRKSLEPECQAIYSAAKSGQLDGVLQAASPQPLALPDIDTCLAYDLIAQKDPEYESYSILGESDRDLYNIIVGPTGEARTAKEAVVAKMASGMANITPAMAKTKLVWPCMPVYIEELKKHPGAFPSDEFDEAQDDEGEQTAQEAAAPDQPPPEKP